MTLITDHMVQAAFDYLNDAADAAAKAKADRILSEHRRKSGLAKLILDSPEETDTRRKAWAESQPVYAGLCEDEAKSVYADEWHRHQRGKAEAVIEAWRTEQANLRIPSRM